MMRDGLVNDPIKRHVLQALKPIVTNQKGISMNGDLKGTVLYLFEKK